MSDLWRYKGTFRLNKVEDFDKAYQLIQEVLTGHSYEFVCTYEYKQWRPEVRRNQVSKDFHSYNHNDYKSFNVNDSYGVWGLSFSKLNDPNEYVDVFGNGLLIHLKTPAGLWCWWMIILEEEE